MTSSIPILNGMKIGFFGKGGAGKTTLCIFLAEALRRRGYEVCILDADSTNIGMGDALGLKETPPALIEAFGGMVFSGGRVTCPVDDPTPLPDAEQSLDRLADYTCETEDGIHYLSAGKMGRRPPGAGCDGPIAKIARDLQVRDGGNDLVTLVDFKAGFEDSARGVVTGLDWAVVVVDPSPAAICMARDMKALVAQIKAGAEPATEHLENLQLIRAANRLYLLSRIMGVSVVLNKIAGPEQENLVLEKLAAHGIEPLGVVRQDSAISDSWLRSGRLSTSKNLDELEQITGSLEEEIAEELIVEEMKGAS